VPLHGVCIVRIREILVRIHPRSGPLLMDPDPAPDPAIFIIDLLDPNKKLLFFCLLPLEGTFTSFFKIKSQKEVTKKQQESRFVLLFLLDDRRIRIRTSTNESGPRRPKNIRIPDPQHCFKV
jgi:hypothetical protein